MNAELICSPIPLNCDVCYMRTSKYETVMKVTLGLPVNSNLYLWITDKFNNQYKYYFTSNSLGQLVIDISDFIDGFFNPDTGSFNIFISTDTDGINVVDMNVLGTVYSCMVFKTTCENVTSYLLQENGDYLLQENGFRIII